MIKCGRCKGEHETVAEIQNCYDIRVSIDPGKVTGVAVHGPKHEFLTASQFRFLNDLLRQAGAEIQDGTPTDRLPYPRGKAMLEGMITFRQRGAYGGEQTLPEGIIQVRPPEEKYPSLPDIPAGHYGVPSLTGNNDFDFFRVDRPTEGDFAGRIFVKRIIGGQPDTNVRGRTRREALEAISEYGIHKAEMLYAKEIGQCYRCNRHLTKYASRRLGRGRTCAYATGQGERWDFLQQRFEAKHGKEGNSDE